MSRMKKNDTARIRSQQKEIKLDLELDSCEPKFDLSRFVIINQRIEIKEKD